MRSVSMWNRTVPLHVVAIAAVAPVGIMVARPFLLLSQYYPTGMPMLYAVFSGVLYFAMGWFVASRAMYWWSCMLCGLAAGLLLGVGLAVSGHALPTVWSGASDRVLLWVFIDSLLGVTTMALISWMIVRMVYPRSTPARKGC